MINLKMIRGLQGYVNQTAASAPKSSARPSARQSHGFNPEEAPTDGKVGGAFVAVNRANMANIGNREPVMH